MRIALIAVITLFVASATACGGDDDGGTADAAGAIDAEPALTWNSFADGFFETFCHECHGPGDALRDYSVLSMVQAEMATIKCGVSKDTLPNCTVNAAMFPIGNGAKPTDAERDMLVQWIDEGAVE
jgi:uncharacterized membrane protein